MSPTQTRKLFAEKGWSSVVAFQTRNPLHRSHEYLVKIAIEICDGVMIHSLLGKLKAGYPLDMRYADPHEALLHALFRQNYGCSHLIVGRDHAGVGDYYGPFDAHHIFDEIPADALEIQPLKIDWIFYCYKCGGIASMKTCPHESADRLMLPGSKLRKLLSEEGEVPAEFSRPEVLAILRQYYAGLAAHEKLEVKVSDHSAK